MLRLSSWEGTFEPVNAQPPNATDVPKEFQITDFRDPDHSWVIRAFNALMPMPRRLLPIDGPALMRAAERKTGLRDFGGGGWQSRFDLVIRTLNEEANLSPLGRFNTRQSLQLLLQARLKAEQLLKDHPEILQTPVRAPIIIYGLPRTGTTLLHRLVARDQRLRHLRYWESENPLPLGSVEKPLPQPDPRIKKAEQRLALLHKAAPLVVAMHEMNAEEPDEELWLMAVDFASLFFTGGYYVPSYTRWLAQADLTESYRYLYRMLQILQWYRPAERWLLKCPQHLGHVGALLKVFPDATFVQTHRDPCTALGSVASMISYVARFNTKRPDPVRIGRSLNDLLEELLRRSIEQRPEHSERFVDVLFSDLVRDPFTQIRKIYEAAGRELSEHTQSAMQDYLRTNPAGRHGKHVYDLADFGLDHADRRRAFSFYSERFNVPHDKP